MKIEEHEDAYKEHLENINKCVEEGVVDNQRNIGYNVSQGSVELFAIYLHKLNLVQSSGDQFNHRVFKSRFLSEKKIPLEFPEKKKILELMKKIELERNALCYGKRKSEKRVGEIVRDFQKLRKLINEVLKNVSKK